MPLLRDVRSLFRRRQKTVEIDISGTQAEGLTTVAPETDVSVGTLDRVIEPKTIEPKAIRTRITPETARTYEEVLGMVRRIGDHLESQAERTERLLSLMDRLPQALDSLPELNRQNSRLLEALHQHFTQAKGREETLNSTLSTMTEASGRQTEVLGLIQQQVETSSQTAGHLTETLGSMQGAISNLADSNTRSTEVFVEMAEATSRRESELATALLGTQRWIIAAVLCCGGVSVIAMIIAALALAQ